MMYHVEKIEKISIISFITRHITDDQTADRKSESERRISAEKIERGHLIRPCQRGKEKKNQKKKKEKKDKTRKRFFTIVQIAIISNSGLCTSIYMFFFLHFFILSFIYCHSSLCQMFMARRTFSILYISWFNQTPSYPILQCRLWSTFILLGNYQ